MAASKRPDFWYYAPFMLLAVLATFVVRQHVFFWDTIQLGSKHAHWFYENNFQKLLLPEEFDSGHPPVFGMYLAALWIFLGKNLTVSHFAMLPFLLANCWLLFKIGKQYAGQIGGLGVLALCTVDPTFAAQSILISPDVVLVTWFLLAWWSILQKRKWLLALAVLGLGMVSMRGMMVGVALFLFQLALKFREQSTTRNQPFSINTFFTTLLPYLPGGLLALAFLIWHYQQTGWIGYHAASPWAPSFDRVGMAGFLKNTAIFGWRMLDFGRIGVWLVAAVGLFFWYKKSPFRSPKLFQLLTLLALLLLLLTPSQLLHRGLLAQRYLLPVFVSLNVLTVFLLQKMIPSLHWRRGLFVLAFLSLLTGNFWVYPKKIAQGWDSTLAHVPHYALRAEMLDFIEQEQIPLSKIGTVFPEIGPLTYKDLSGRTEGFATADLETQNYILYATTMNDFTDDELTTLESWTVVKRLEKNRIAFILYRRPQ